MDLDDVRSDDPRSLAAGRAMATWAWAVVYTKAHGLAGFVPHVALGASWVGQRQAAKDAAALAMPEVGLFEVVEGGWRIASSRARGDARSPDAIRMAKKRADRKANAATEQPANSSRTRSPNVHEQEPERSAERPADSSRTLARSPSDLGIESSSFSGLSPDHPDSPPCPEPDPLTHPPAWRDEQVASVALARGRKPNDPEHCWALFVTKAQRDARAITPEAWKAFVVMQIGYDAADARKNPNRVRAIQRDERPPAYEKATPEDHEAHLEELIAEAKKGATGS